MLDETQVKLIRRVNAIREKMAEAGSRIEGREYFPARDKVREALADLLAFVHEFDPKHCPKCDKIRGPHAC